MIATAVEQKRKTKLLAGAPVVIVAAAILYFVGAGHVSLWDRDEAWYAQTSKQMLESRDWVVPRFGDSPRYAKPILVYWCQAASMKVFGPTPLAARIPSFVAMIGTITVLAIVLRRAVGPQRSSLTTLIFASSAMVIASAKMCLTDSVMLFFLTTAQLAIFSIYRNSNTAATPWLLWTAVGGAILTKGPFPVVVLLATLIVLALLDVQNWKSAAAWRDAIRWWWRLRPLMGIIIVSAIVAPWLIMLYRREPAAFRAMLGEPVRHLASNQDSQWVYPGYYPLTIWLTFFPWSLLLPAALIYGWKRRKQPMARFALATILGNWIFAELMITKLPHYMLASFSSLAFLTAGVLSVWMRRQTIPWQMKAGAVVWGMIAVALAMLPWGPQPHFKVPLIGAILFTGIGVIYAISVTILWLRHRPAAASGVMGLGMMGVIAILFGLYFPRADFLRIPQHAGTKLKEQNATDAIMIGFTEPSLAFYQGGTIRPRPDDFLITQPPANWPPWIVLSCDIYDALPPERRRLLEQIASYHGFNYNIPMRPVTVIVARKRYENH
jgi:4-amino-4-deoxy-L-arabinose transferase-like glycosyltransferase